MTASFSGAPNIVLVFSDQHRGDALGCAGNSVVTTPHLDSLAAEGVLFRNGQTSSPLCMPARASLLCGEYVNAHGVWGSRHEMEASCPSHVRNVQNAGYCTAVFGKTHFRVPQVDDGHVREHGDFLHNLGYEVAHEVHETPSSSSSCYYSDFLAGRKKQQVRDSSLALWKYGQGNKTLRPWEHLPWQLEEDEHIDAYIASKAIEWIQSYKDPRPFYLQVNLVGPHPPFDPPIRFRDMFRPEDMPSAIMDLPAEPMSPLVRTMLERRGVANMSESQSRLMKSHYYAKIAYDDEIIGQVIQSLIEQGLMDNTWIIYTSDHGEMLGDHRLVQKVVFYEGAQNIPLIIRPPGGTDPWVVNGLADHYDIVSTILDVANGAPLENDHGVSLAPKIQAGKDAANAQGGKEVSFSEVRHCSMARTDKYKMAIDSITREPLELYDMENDPDELENLVNEPSLTALREEMQRKYFDELLANMNMPQLEVSIAGGIPSAIHQDYPEY